MILAGALVISAFLSIYLERVTHAVISFAIMFILLSGLYFSLNAPFAAIFQLTIGIGTVIVFFLLGEMTSPKRRIKQSFRNVVLGIIVAIVLTLPSILVTIRSESSMIDESVSFASALWNLRGLDITAQGLIILMISLGVAIAIKRGGKSNG